jgi:hypothetical protein
MTPVGKVSNQEENLRTNDKGLMGEKTIIIAQPKVICTNLASGNCLFFKTFIFIVYFLNFIMTSFVKVSNQENNLKANDKDSMGTSPGKIAQPRRKKSNQAGNCFIFNLYNDLIMVGPKRNQSSRICLNLIFIKLI